GGYGLSIRTEDIARFGQLYLQRGRWQGKQLVPEAWIEAATARQTSNGSDPESDWAQGYGYQFWRCRHGAYRGDGAFGQFCIVLPEQDAVIAMTSGLKNMQSVLNLVWEKLLPAIKSSSLPADDVAAGKLRAASNGLSLDAVDGAASHGDLVGKRFLFAANEHTLQSITLEPDTSGSTVTLVARIGEKDQRIACDRGAWRKGSFAWLGLPEQPVAASGAWTEANVFTARLCFYETPFTVTVALKLAGDELQCSTKSNVGFGANTELRLTAKAE
ncbi:MAG TPA: serine hydrolase, partial [Pirellulales bacterium]|nr:serine hydrolase [Pirellulales bacterium]